MELRNASVFGGRYEVRALLGRGGMADVFRAYDPVTGHDVAVKAFRAGSELRDVEQRRRREVELAASLNHPGLVQILDADVGDESARRGGAAFIVFELVEGSTLRRRIQRGPIDEREVASLGADLADTLDYIHRHGIVHRDVKPANILIPAGAAGVRAAKLSDFGTALVTDGTRMTAPGLTIGTANYLSPEQVTSSSVGPASDVYSLGLVLIEALTGDAAYAAHGIEAALARLDRPPIIPGRLDPVFAATLTAMTARDPAARITSGEVAQRLNGISEPSLATDILALGTYGRERHRAQHLSPRRRTSRQPFRLLRRSARVVEVE